MSLKLYKTEDCKTASRYENTLYDADTAPYFYVCTDSPVGGMEEIPSEEWRELTSEQKLWAGRCVMKQFADDLRLNEETYCDLMMLYLDLLENELKKSVKEKKKRAKKWRRKTK